MTQRKSINDHPQVSNGTAFMHLYVMVERGVHGKENKMSKSFVYTFCIMGSFYGPALIVECSEVERGSVIVT